MGVSKSETPEPINKKFGTGAYVGNITPHNKIQNERPMAHLGTWVKYYSCMVLSSFFACLWPKQNNRFLCCLIRRASVPGYCTPRDIKLCDKKVCANSNDVLMTSVVTFLCGSLLYIEINI